MAGKKSRNKKAYPDSTAVARAIFAATEGMGITDRETQEQLTNEVLRNLERKIPLPGMEHLLPGSERQSISLDQVRTLVSQATTRQIPKQAEQPAPKVEEKTSAEGRPGLTPNALKVLEKRYLKKDEQGQVIETPDELFHRVARNIASAELAFNPQGNVRSWEAEFYRVMTALEFLPNSPTLMNAGRELQQLSACFVIPIEDSMESIFDAVKYTALIHKSGGGTGFSFSRLRPETDRVGSTGGVASGPVSFMRAFDTATDVIKQGGMRRGANMAILNVEHPDILRFIEAKNTPGTLTNFNLSVAVNANFMKAAEKGEDYELINPRTEEVAGKLNAKEVFDKIVDLAWRTGDPGIIFIDRINQDNPTPKLGAIESTNPCGEQPLLPFESCNLGSVNLARMLRSVDSRVEVDFERLEQAVNTAVRFLDNVIEMNHFPLPQIERMTKLTRKIGLGVMGFADMLLQLSIPYDSEEAIKLAERLMSFINDKANQASVRLAQERGVFPAFEGSKYDVPGGLRARNAARTTIAPTGSLSIIAGCSSGIEPLFALSFQRHILDGEEMVEVNPYFDEVSRREKFYSPELMETLAQGTHLQDIEGIPDWVKRVFVTAHDITPEWHVRTQAAFQKSTDNAVSKTVNFPHDATRDDVAKVYHMAFELGLKGITIYRDRSKESQVLTMGQRDEKKTEAVPGTGLVPRSRPKVTSGYTELVNTGCGHIYVTVNSDEQGICEVFSSLGKAGGCASAQLEATCRLISLALRSGIEPTAIVKHLRGIRCPSIAWEEGHAVLSCADAIGSVLEKHMGGESGNLVTASSSTGQCPDCGGMLVYEEGCHHCPGCGYTKC